MSRTSLVFLVGLASLAAVPPLSAQVVIHELLAQNETGIRDADGDRSDWIEIRNLGGDTVDLGGWYLTDNGGQLARWQIPAAASAVLDPGEILLVFASGKDRAGSELHTNFKLAAEGEYLALVEPDGTTVAHELFPSYPPQRADISFGFAAGEDGLPIPNADPAYLDPPTPRAVNTANTVQFVSDTMFSVGRGFFTEPFMLEIETRTPGATIRYTTDGSAPTPTSGEIYTGPILIDGTTVVRAIAYRSGFEPTNVDTQTYLFLGDVIEQPKLPEGYPSTWAGQAADYEMDPAICTNTNSPTYQPTIRSDLMSIPTLSIVASPDDLFGPSRGIYTHPLERGSAWERPCSIEFFTADRSEEFQIDCGVRMHGNSSARPIEGKHPFRLQFRGRYGASVLKHDLFPDSEVDEFDCLVLRCFSTDSWHFKDGGSRYRRWDSQYIRDPFLRKTQIEMGQPGSHTRYVHLYVNGLYWGLYDVAERPDDEFQANYLGGRPEDWDVVKDFTESFRGNLQSWNQLMAMATSGFTTRAAYEAVQGNLPDGTPDPSRAPLLDVDNLIDWMILHIWGGAEDWPHHNWYAARNRTGETGGWRFYVWDQEIILDFAFRNRVDVSDSNTPAYVYSRLRQNPEFRLRFADRVRKHLGPGGVLSIESARERWLELARTIDRAIVGESARWGDFRVDVPDPTRSPAELYTREDHWLPEQSRVLNEYIPESHRLALERFKGRGLYPQLDPPIVQPRGHVERGRVVTMTAASGARIFYTVDGGDPRLAGGNVSPEAQEYGGGERLVLVAGNAPLRAIVPADGAFGLDWTETDFDDSAWIEGTNGIGFERLTGYEQFIGLDLGEAMDGVNGSAYARIPFEVDGLSLEGLVLKVQYDDGFVAWINGVEIARRNAPEALAWNSTATAPRPDSEAIIPEVIDLSEHADLLRDGENVLAIQGLNSSVGSNDFLVRAELEAVGQSALPIAIDRTTRVKARALSGDTWSALEDILFVVDSSGLRITEVMFHPPAPLSGRRDADDFEFLEIANLGAYPLSLSGVRIRGGIRFNFPEMPDPSDDLPPGGVVLLVRDRQAFAERYGESGFKIAGEYDGNLGNGGDRIILEDALGQTLLDFEYVDDWYPNADGKGSSLEPTDALAPPHRFSEPEFWRASDLILGTPGEFGDSGPSGLLRVGDVNADATVDLSDAVSLLAHLFAGDRELSLPCEGDSIDDGGNPTIFDVNGDAGIDLTDAVFLLRYLFVAGPPPALGASCIPVEGCAHACP